MFWRIAGTIQKPKKRDFGYPFKNRVPLVLLHSLTLSMQRLYNITWSVKGTYCTKTLHSHQEIYFSQGSGLKILKLLHMYTGD